MIGAGLFAKGWKQLEDNWRFRRNAKFDAKRLRKEIGFPGGVVIADSAQPKPALSESIAKAMTGEIM